VALVSALVAKSGGMRQTAELATSHARLAAEALGALPPSESRDALINLCFMVLNRTA